MTDKDKVIQPHPVDVLSIDQKNEEYAIVITFQRKGDTFPNVSVESNISDDIVMDYVAGALTAGDVMIEGIEMFSEELDKKENVDISVKLIVNYEYDEDKSQAVRSYTFKTRDNETGLSLEHEFLGTLTLCAMLMMELQDQE